MATKVVTVVTYVLVVALCVAMVSSAAVNDGTQGSTKAKGTKLWTMLVDGFRWDYFDHFAEDDLPGFKKLKEKGVKNEYLQPVFTSYSFVNFYSLMTGLYAESHGQVHNNMYDPKHKQSFDAGGNAEQYFSYWWDDGEPIWVTAEQQGQSAHMWYWNGCEVRIRGYRPTYCHAYQDTSNPTMAQFAAANDKGIQLFADGAADLVATYLEQVDHYGHVEGPDGPTLKEYIKKVDDELLRVQDELEDRGLWDEVNFMLFSDHGMMYSDDEAELCINFIQYLDEADVLVATGSGNGGPSVLLWPVDGKEDKVYDDLIRANVKGLIVHKKENIPERYHYRDHVRIPPILLEAEPRYAILRPDTNECKYFGYHGYDNELEDMRGIFLARGPDFKEGYEHPGFENIELYQIMCHLLNLEPAVNNGTWDNVEDLLIMDDGGSDNREEDTSNNQKLFILVVDGFRWDYFDDFDEDELPGFKLMREKGVTNEYLQPVFTSYSFVNYYSLMTGLYAETNGQVHNYMYDPEHDTEFLAGVNAEQYLPYWWDDGEPIWITTEKQGKRAYMWHWNGCEVRIRGYGATYCDSYEDTPNPSLEVWGQANDLGMDYMKDGYADMITTYYQKVDWYGHYDGPDAPTVKEQIRIVDAELLRVQNELESKGLWDTVNLMIFSDHGMMYVPKEDGLCVDFKQYVDMSYIRKVAGSKYGPTYSVWPADGKEDDVYNALTGAHEGMIVYKKADIPERYHYRDHPRIGPIVLEAKPGYAILRPDQDKCGYFGYHGYDNAQEDMRGIFFARGPAFKENYEHDGFENIELYQIMCHVLDLDPAPNNGTWDNVKDMLSGARDVTSLPLVMLLTSSLLRLFI